MNNQTIKESLKVCIYDQCIQRLIHKLHRLQKEYPNEVIIELKNDLDVAYKIMHQIPIDEPLLLTLLDNTFVVKCGIRTEQIQSDEWDEI